MSLQHCPQVHDLVTAAKCNVCNKDVVERTHYCCKYISCILTCDFKDKEDCSGYKEAVKLRELTAKVKKTKKN